LIMVLAAVFHIVRGEYRFFLPVNLVLAGVAAFIAYGRLRVRPVAPAPISTFRLVTAMAVLGAMVFAGFLPVWYQLAHIH
jgi:hypothetical protein